MMGSANGFIWKHLENPGRYVIHTTSNLYTGTTSMTIRQYVMGELAGETNVYINLIDIHRLRNQARNPLNLPSGIECQTQSYRIEAGKLTEINLPLCIFKISEIN